MLTAIGRHPWRPAHIHFILRRRATSRHHAPVPGRRPYLDSDAVFAVKESLIVPVRRVEDPEEARRLGVATPFSLVTYDFRLKPAAARAAA